jgi:hypothetical protein
VAFELRQTQLLIAAKIQFPDFCISLLALLSDNSAEMLETPGITRNLKLLIESSGKMKNFTDGRQPMNRRNEEFYDHSNQFLAKLLKLLPTKIVPLTISQQFEVAKTNRLINAPMNTKPDGP